MLKQPVLPIMDVYGDVVGSDGYKLAKYDVDGTVDDPVISLGDDLFPIYR